MILRLGAMTVADFVSRALLSCMCCVLQDAVPMTKKGKDFLPSHLQGADQVKQSCSVLFSGKMLSCGLEHVRSIKSPVALFLCAVAVKLKTC